MLSRVWIMLMCRLLRRTKSRSKKFSALIMMLKMSITNMTTMVTRQLEHTDDFLSLKER
jgi:hypothetical protein